MKKKSRWNYYGVKIIKQILVEGQPNPELVDEYYEEDGKQSFEESVMLVRAQSFEHAYKIAEKKTTEFEEPYQNPYGQQVTWKFIKAVDCYLILEELVSGTEVYSCFHNTDSGVSADEFINKWFNCDDDGFDKEKLT